MEKVEFFQGFVVLLVCVIALVLVRYAKIREQRDTFQGNARAYEDMMNHYRQKAHDYEYLYQECKDTINVLDGQIKVMNNEIASRHGRSDSNSYYKKSWDHDDKAQ